MIPEFTHRINERLSLVRESATDGLRIRIRRLVDGYYFNPATNNFVDALAPGSTIVLDDLWYLFDDFFEVTELKTITIVTLPTIVQDLIFEFQSFNYEPQALPEDPLVIDAGSITTFYERHIFGGPKTLAEPSLCKVYGTLKDVSGKPLAGQKVEAYLNRAGYFTHKAGLIGYAATTITDEMGYFELPLVVGLDVTVNVPIVGFSSRGYVPNTDQVELTSQALLSYQPG